MRPFLFICRRCACTPCASCDAGCAYRSAVVWILPRFAIFILVFVCLLLSLNFYLVHSFFYRSTRASFFHDGTPQHTASRIQVGVSVVLFIATTAVVNEDIGTSTQQWCSNCFSTSIKGWGIKGFTDSSISTRRKTLPPLRVNLPGINFSHNSTLPLAQP